MTSVFIGIYSTDPAMLRGGVPKSGISIMAGSSPATRNSWMCVKKAGHSQTS
jgi:hypothetical protein